MRISTFLWFDGQAEEAAAQYTSVFADARILETQRTQDGRVTTVVFELLGQRCVAYNGGPGFEFTGAISWYVECETQQEIDAIWAGLVDGGQEGQGGSLTDRFGISWQVLPTALGELLADAEPEAAERVLNAVHGMRKIEIEALKTARDQ